jgi:hypothetical protein
MPIADWQFWVVTAAMLWGAWSLARQFRPRKNAAACPSCATGSAACARRDESPKLVQLGR